MQSSEATQRHQHWGRGHLTPRKMTTASALAYYRAAKYVPNRTEASSIPRQRPQSECCLHRKAALLHSVGKPRGRTDLRQARRRSAPGSTPRTSPPHPYILQPVRPVHTGEPPCLINGRVRDLLQFAQGLSHHVDVVDLQEHELRVGVSAFTFVPSALGL